MAEDYTARFLQLANQDIDAQVKYFLKEFVLEFKGNFEPVLDIAEEFRAYLPAEKAKTEGYVDELQAHLFLEKRSETLTVKELREYLKQVHLANHHPVALIEYLLWKYDKSAAQLFAPPSEEVPPELLEALEQAIAAYQQAIRAQKERDEEIKRMEELAQGKRSVESVQAQNRKHELAGQEFSQKFAELQALKAKKAAQKAVDEAPKGDWKEKEKQRQLEEEQRRLEEEKRKREQEEQRIREESRARLKARAALWQ